MSATRLMAWPFASPEYDRQTTTSELADVDMLDFGCLKLLLEFSRFLCVVVSDVALPNHFPARTSDIILSPQELLPRGLTNGKNYIQTLISLF